MTRCTRCGRTLKAPTASGMGPSCERYVLGSKPKRVHLFSRAQAKRDERTQDLFAGGVA